MESSTIHRVYRFRLEPTAEQEHRFRQFAGARRWVWNWALQQRQEHYQKTGKSLPYTELAARQAVCIEDLNVKGLARTKLAKSVHDASMGMLRRQLQYKGRWYGVHVVVVDRFYPSTQLCHVCGYKNAALTLADRTWHCPLCSTVHDRDINAALNIKNEGLRLLAVGHTAIAQRSRLWRGGKTTDGGAPRRSKNPSAERQAVGFLDRGGSR